MNEHEFDHDEKDAGLADAADGLNRREFLTALAASFAAASGCAPRRPQEKVVPALELGEGVLPGRAEWFATTCGACPAACGALAKVRDGRPIKLEGNPEHPLSRGGLCARGQASVLDLYDSRRIRQPLKAGQPSAWAEADAAVMDALRAAGRSGRTVRLLMGTAVGGAERAAAEAFTARHGGKSFIYDPVSSSAILDAHRLTHGRRALPRYHFAQAKVIVGFDADFLGTWLSPVEFTKDWAANRRPADEWDMMSWHAQFESRMSLTGANADLRVALKPSAQRHALALLGNLLAARTGWAGPRPAHGEVPPRVEKALRDAADLLVAAKGRALVVSGSADASTQVLVNWANHMLGAYGATLELSRASRQADGDDAALPALIAELEAGRVGVLVVWGVNPAYDNPHAAAFRAAAKKAGLLVSLSGTPDETAALAQWVCPDHHALESWGDAEPGAGVRSLRQPALAPLYDTRAALETLGAWAGRPVSAHEAVREAWRREVFPRQKEARDFESFWTESLRRGAATVPAEARGEGRFDAGALAGLKAAPAPGAGFEPVLYPSVMLYDGRQANNPWLQELPDPVTKACWGNWASLSPEDAAELGVVEGRLLKLAAGPVSVVLPAHLQPGQARGTVAAAVGYGRPNAGPVAANFPTEKMFPLDKEPGGGADVFPLAGRGAVSVTPLDGMDALAKTQTYDHQADPITKKPREHLRETTLQEFLMDPRAGNPREAESGLSLWPGHKYEGRKWAMAVDLSLCTGCSACVTACQAENNVPVVGKAEVRKSRDMAWMRVDRYYSGAPGEEAEPETAFQPMLCQHCDNAPCETVCPVLATVHSTEGLNMQVYNRCVGTRYCANNCPYKVRRFNWFDYAHQDLAQNLALNPDVTVRTRGVMEKCSFCVQRIYSARSEAKAEGRELKGHEVRPACAQSCPADAIVFGDYNEEGSPVRTAAEEPRSYRVLPDLGVGSSVYYRTKVRNKKV